MENLKKKERAGMNFEMTWTFGNQREFYQYQPFTIFFNIHL